MQKANGVPYKPKHGTLAAIAEKRGVSRQAVQQAYQKGVPEIVAAVIEHDLRQIEADAFAMEELAKAAQEAAGKIRNLK